VRAGYATLTEVHTSWSLLDLWEANAVISAFEAAEAKAAETR